MDSNIFYFSPKIYNLILFIFFFFIYKIGMTIFLQFCVNQNRVSGKILEKKIIHFLVKNIGDEMQKKKL